MGHSLKILGRTSSINVRKVLWTCQELGIDYVREDWGIGFKPTQSPDFLALNPNAQVPVLIDNLLASMAGKQLPAAYDGYASCPLLTGHNELMLCEFKYGGVPKETFAHLLGGQETPNALYYHLKNRVFVSSSPFLRCPCLS